MTQQYDIAVIGAGFAGLACAKEAAQRGLRVVVLDRKKSLAEHIHTTGIFVQEAAEEYALPASLAKPIGKVRLYAPSLRYADFTHASYRFFATDTPALMEYMKEDARAHGVEIRLDTAYDGHEDTGEGVRLCAQSVEAKFLIGADGARSQVAKQAGLPSNSYMLKGAEYEYDRIGGVGDRLHVFLDSELAPGYIGWVFQGVKVCQVGLACTAPHAPDIPVFLEKIKSLFDFSASTLVGRRGGWIPVGGTLRDVAKDNVLLVGDAAGMVSPLTAGGIYTALRYGKEVSRTVDEFLKGEGAPPAAVLPALYPRFGYKHWLRWLIDRRPSAWMYELLVRGLVFKSLLAGVFYSRQKPFLSFLRKKESKHKA